MIATNSTVLVLFSLLASAAAWTNLNQPTSVRRLVSSTASSSREDFLKSMATIAVASATNVLLPTTAAFAAEETTLPNGVTITIKKKGDGPKPENGELVAIRFAAYAGDTKIDDIFETPEPYYTRVGSGGLLKGVETTLPLMRVGDRWVLSIPVRT
jgi:FKBP-type peptidyl-prolyl cis-trans isomerase